MNKALLVLSDGDDLEGASYRFAIEKYAMISTLCL
jgi:hypothetical protein